MIDSRGIFRFYRKMCRGNQLLVISHLAKATPAMCSGTYTKKKGKQSMTSFCPTESVLNLDSDVMLEKDKHLSVAT